MILGLTIELDILIDMPQRYFGITPTLFVQYPHEDQAAHWLHMCQCACMHVHVQVYVCKVPA